MHQPNPIKNGPKADGPFWPWKRGTVTAPEGKLCYCCDLVYDVSFAEEEDEETGEKVYKSIEELCRMCKANLSLGSEFDGCVDVAIVKVNSGEIPSRIRSGKRDAMKALFTSTRGKVVQSFHDKYVSKQVPHKGQTLERYKDTHDGRIPPDGTPWVLATCDVTGKIVPHYLSRDLPSGEIKVDLVDNVGARQRGTKSDDSMMLRGRDAKNTMKALGNQVEATVSGAKAAEPEDEREDGEDSDRHESQPDDQKSESEQSSSSDGIMSMLGPGKTTKSKPKATAKPKAVPAPQVRAPQVKAVKPPQERVVASGSRTRIQSAVVPESRNKLPRPGESEKVGSQQFIGKPAEAWKAAVPGSDAAVDKTKNSIEWHKLEALWKDADKTCWKESKTFRSVNIPYSMRTTFEEQKKTCNEKYTACYTAMQKEAIKLSKRVGVPRQVWDLLMYKRNVCHEFSQFLGMLTKATGKGRSSVDVDKLLEITTKLAEVLEAESNAATEVPLGLFGEVIGLRCEDFSRAGFNQEVMKLLDSKEGAEGVLIDRCSSKDALAFARATIEMIIVNFATSSAKGAMEESDSKERLKMLGAFAKAGVDTVSKKQLVLAEADMEDMKLLNCVLEAFHSGEDVDEKSTTALANKTEPGSILAGLVGTNLFVFLKKAMEKKIELSKKKAPTKQPITDSMQTLNTLNNCKAEDLATSAKAHGASLAKFSSAVQTAVAEGVVLEKQVSPFIQSCSTAVSRYFGLVLTAVAELYKVWSRLAEDPDLQAAVFPDVESLKVEQGMLLGVRGTDAGPFDGPIEVKNLKVKIQSFEDMRPLLSLPREKLLELESTGSLESACNQISDVQSYVLAAGSISELGVAYVKNTKDSSELLAKLVDLDDHYRNTSSGAMPEQLEASHNEFKAKFKLDHLGKSDYQKAVAEVIADLAVIVSVTKAELLNDESAKLEPDVREAIVNKCEISMFEAERFITFSDTQMRDSAAMALMQKACRICNVLGKSAASYIYKLFVSK